MECVYLIFTDQAQPTVLNLSWNNRTALRERGTEEDAVSRVHYTLSAVLNTHQNSEWEEQLSPFLPIDAAEVQGLLKVTKSAMTNSRREPSPVSIQHL